MLTTMLKREGQFWQEMLQGWSDSLVWEVGLEGKRRKCNFQKGYGGIMPRYCLWHRCDVVLLQIWDMMVPEAGWRVLDVSVGCCERGSGSQGTVQFSSTLRM